MRPHDEGGSRDPAAAPRPGFVQERVPLSFNQEGLWFIEQLAPARGVYDIAGSVVLEGRLDPVALRGALSQIVRRHEILRSHIGADRHGPYQEVEDGIDIPLPSIDLSGIAPGETESALRREMDRELARPIRLSAAPLFRARLLKLSADRHVLLFKLPHIACDGWSMGVFTSELCRLYPRLAAGADLNLPPLPLQYADFARWEREHLRGRRLERHLDFWRARLDVSSSGLELRPDRPRPAEPSFEGVHLAVRLSAELTARVRRLAKDSRCTPFHTLMTAFVVAASLPGTRQGAIGVPYANRTRTELEELIGYFVNVLPLRVDTAGGATFAELQRRVRDEALAIAAHQELPLAKLVREVQPERNLSRNPLFQVVFYYLTPEHNPAVYGYGIAGAEQEVRMGDLRIRTLARESGFSRFDLAVVLWDMPEGIRGTVEYSTELFAESTIDRLVRRFESALEKATSRPRVRISTLLGFIDRRETSHRRARSESIADTAIERLRSIRPR